MKKILKTGLAIGLILTAVFALAGCGGDKKDDAGAKADDKTLVVGLDDTFAPMGFRDEKGDLVGFDIDLAKAVGKELGMEVKFKPIDWNAKEAELKAGTVNCIWNGMSATPERKKSMALSDKYLDNKIVLMAMKDGDVNVTSADQLKDVKIGTQTDSAALEMLKANKDYDSFKDNITEYPTYDAAIMDLKAGRVDVIAVDQVLGQYTNKNLGDIMKECSYNLGNDYYVIGFAKDNEELRDKVNDALKKLYKDGEMKEISEKWFGTDIAVCEPLD